ncbi:MAG: hypothetical protein M1837_000868 [Sclerophora amabilis]|nr:MAG: hypothetical protein M1837_000868 [Sclerophora amabilis]
MEGTGNLDPDAAPEEATGTSMDGLNLGVNPRPAPAEADLMTPKGVVEPTPPADDASPATLGDPARTPRSDAPSAVSTPLSGTPRLPQASEGVHHDYFASPPSLQNWTTVQPSPSLAASSANSSASNSANVSTSSIPELHHYSKHSTPSPVHSTSSQDSSDILRDLVKSRASRTTVASESPTVSSFPSGLHATQTVDSTTAQGERDYPVYPNQAFSALQSQAYPPPHIPRPPRTHSSRPYQHSSYSANAAARRRSRDMGHVEMGSRTAGNTPVSSPGLFGPAGHPPASAPAGEADHYSSPYLHWTQLQRPKETHIADVDIDPISGRKVLNQYEIIDELGRGVHGKVKLGRSLEKNQDVAIKIVDRYSKRRRLGKLGNPEDKTKREVAILKKAIHPNVVSLLEVIDDPAKKKVYIVLEFVELGEISWRVQGVKEIVNIERRRIQNESKGHLDPIYEAENDRLLEEAEQRRGKTQEDPATLRSPAVDYWSLEYGEDSENETDMQGNGNSRLERWTPDVSGTSGPADETGGPSPSKRPLPLSGSTHQAESSTVPSTSAPPQSHDQPSANPEALTSALDGSMYGAYLPESSRRGGPNSAEDSVPTTLSADAEEDLYVEDYAYVPCLTLAQARQTFRDTVLGLEYLHYQGIIHRDLKPANLLWNAEYRVKISDFGVSYLGRPIRDDDTGEDLSESDAQPLDEAVELAKTVGTPAFYAPELCYTDLTAPRPPVTGQIDLWSLGVTLYCLLFARVPFLAEDQFALFKSIAEDDVFIPRKRLKAVDSGARENSRPRSRNYRDNDHRLATELIYEDIDDDLYDLLRRILEKDPTKRITLREVKRHPFVLHGIKDPIKWIDETDPSRQNEGRKIEVSNEDVEQAVVPLGFLERVRSSMRKVGAAIGFGKAREGRRRAQSGAYSADGGASSKSTSPAATIRDERHPSLRGDESIFNALKSSREGDHPLSQSLTASPEVRPDNPFFHAEYTQPYTATSNPLRKPSVSGPVILTRPSPPDRSISTSGGSTRTIRPSKSSDGARSSSPFPSPGLPDQPTAIDSTASSNLGGIFGGAGRRLLRSMRSRDLRNESEKGPGGIRRPSSVDRVAMSFDDSHAEPSVAFSSTCASGRVDPPPSLREGSSTASKHPAGTTPSNAFYLDPLHSPQPYRAAMSGHSPGPIHGPSQAEPNIRPTTAPNLAHPDSAINPHAPLRPRPYESTEESFALAQAQLYRRRNLELERLRERPISAAATRYDDALQLDCPPSPDDEIFYRKQLEEDRNRLGGFQASGSDHGVASPTANEAIGSSSSEDRMGSGMSQSFSHPSVPSVLSASSSISADDSAMALPKATEFILSPRQESPVVIPSVDSDDDAGYNGDHADDSDEEDFLVMTRRKSRSKGFVRSESVSNAQLARHGERHGIGGTLKKKRSGSSGTLKKVLSNEEDRRRKGSLDN